MLRIYTTEREKVARAKYLGRRIGRTFSTAECVVMFEYFNELEITTGLQNITMFSTMVASAEMMGW